MNTLVKHMSNTQPSIPVTHLFQHACHIFLPACLADTKYRIPGENFVQHPRGNSLFRMLLKHPIHHLCQTLNPACWPNTPSSISVRHSIKIACRTLTPASLSNTAAILHGNYLIQHPGHSLRPASLSNTQCSIPEKHSIQHPWRTFHPASCQTPMPPSRSTTQSCH